MTHVASLFILASSLTWMSAEASILCVWTKVLPSGDVHSSFLRQDSLSVRLYHSVWSREQTLQNCAWSDQTSVIDNYLSACRQRSQDFSDHLQLQLKLELDSVSEADCDSVDSSRTETAGWFTQKRSVRSAGERLPAGNSQGQDGRSEVRGHSRWKRGFIVPGTLWCGSGNKALSFTDLGVFADTDSCCREHDQCKHTILSFHSQFGVFNRNIFTMSHCDCDNKFRQCLRDADDSISDAVGYTFFNLLKMHCFEFSHQLQCTLRNWFGMCKETKQALYAEVHPPTLYESTNPTGTVVNVTSPLLNTTAPTAPVQSPTADPRLLPITAATPSTVSPALTTTPSIDTDLRRSCAIYKGLDECTDVILPQQTKYGLHNPETRTIYHCNCTASCTATLVRADLPQHSRRNDTGVDAQRPLEALTSQDRRPNSRRTRRKGRGMKLHRLCLRMLRPKEVKRTSGKSPSV
uniref:phospholipase A2 n=1 Tax=Cynoglossus semilaevis TaxID=244447 RepID=A0A3P8W0J1_CYNSE